MRYCVRQIQQAVGGKLLQGDLSLNINSICIDSRKVKKGSVFIAVIGQRLDGHRFIRQAISRGARAVIVSKKVKAPSTVSVLKVADTTKALGLIALFHRRQFDIPLIAITGSAGKTTTKEMVASVLASRYKVLKNIKTENNHIGVPLTLLRLTKTHQIAVIECGTNQPGDIDWLSRICEPTAVILTNTGPSHLQGLKSVAGVFREKIKLIKHMRPGGAVIFNGDDFYLNKLTGKALGCEKIRFSLQSKGKYQAQTVLQERAGVIRFRVNGKSFRIKAYARTQILNALAAICCGYLFKISYNNINTSTTKFSPSSGRQKVIRRGGHTIIDDSYNANPLSMRLSLEAFDALPVKGRRIFVCADMLELGTHSKSLHQKLGMQIARSSVDILITLGGQTQNTAKKARTSSALRVISCRTYTQVKRALKSLIQPGDALLVKGSRSMKTEQIVQYAQTF